MDAKKLYVYMLRYPDFYWELDLHTLPRKKAVHMAEKILEVFEHNETVLKHCLVQVNSMEMYRGIDSVYHFPYYQYNVKNDIGRLDEFLAFCQENDICAMALKKVFATPEVIRKIRDAGLALLVFTVDNKAKAEELLELGANTICTNFIGIEQHKTDADEEAELLRLKDQERIDRMEEKERKRQLLRKKVKKNLKEPHMIPIRCVRKLGQLLNKTDKTGD
jgi:hypothetical protein